MAKMYQTKALLEWKERVLNWIKIYGREEQKISFGFDPTRIIAVKLCAKCGKFKDKMQRHHIGSEMAFAKIAPDYYARRYVSFLSEDIAWLCTRHHKQAHVLYRPLMGAVFEYAKQCQLNGTQPNPHHLELMRQQIRKSFAKWLAIKPRKNKKNARPSGKQSSSHSNRRSKHKSGWDNNSRHSKGKSRPRDS